ncbi:hypothetical protein HC928_13040 [bacterium]|nr:hypothetical protein [bacterium]
MSRRPNVIRLFGDGVTLSPAEGEVIAAIYKEPFHKEGGLLKKEHAEEAASLRLGSTPGQGVIAGQRLKPGRGSRSGYTA